AAADEDRRALEVARVVAGRAVRAYEAAAEADNTAVAPRVPRAELEREARPLRESEKDHTLGWHVFRDVGQNFLEHRYRRREMRLVAVDGRGERVRIPGVPRGLRRQVCEVGMHQLLTDGHDVGRAGAASVDQKHRRVGFGEGRT